MKSLYLHFSTFLLIFLGIFIVSVQAQVVINEYSVSNLSTVTDNYSSYEDWIELYNSGGSSADIGGYFLSDNPSNLTKWQFPEGTTIPSGGFIIIWASGRNEVSGGHYHTSFKLTQTKDTPESVILTDPQGVIVDQVQLEITRKDHSRGRTINGGVEWSVFLDPTPESSNNSSTAYTAYAAKPEMSVEAGFYSISVTVEITTDQPNSEIHYTTDGSKPISTSPVYSGPVNITSTTILKAVTICADPDILYSLIEFNTYFINESHSLTVMSCSAAQLDNLLNGNQYLVPFGTFEYFNKEGERTTFGYGEFNKHGQDSWVWDQRSIDYVTRDECGYNYAIRENLIPYYTDRDEFQRIILRAAGDDNYPGIDTSALLRDYFVENLATKAGMSLDCRKGEKGVLYVNGQYWGVYGYREKVSDHDYTKYYYNQGKFDIQFLMLWGGTWAQYGGQQAFDDWNELHDFAKNNDMANEDNYNYVASQLDITSLVDYVLINSYVVCSDWINWNVGWWRGLNPDGGHRKWGYVLWDEDATFAHYINYTGVPGISPTTSPCYPQGLTNDPEEHIVLLNRLRNNPTFNQYYVSRYVDLMNTAFDPDYMIDLLDSIHDGMAPEMPQHVERWGGSVSEWEDNVQKIRDFITDRAAYIPDGFEGCWDLTGPYDINFDVQPAGKGFIKVNSLLLKDFPWNGKYYDGINTLLSAISDDPYYEFDYWELDNNAVSPSDTIANVSVMISQADNIIAHFKIKELADSLVINEINYNSANNFDTRDWVEFYNPHEYEMNITNWVFKDDNDEHEFVFPEGTAIPAFGFLVLVRDSSTFNEFFPNVDNYIGEFDFGISNNGELIRLFNNEGVLVDTVHYDNNDPWPTAPDGTGPTLELINWQYDNALPESWAASENHGTPGEINSMTTIIHKQETENISFVIYPNPFSTSAILQVTSDLEIVKGEINIYDVFGKKVKKIENINTNRFEISRDGLVNGVYICIFSDEKNNVLGTRKLMVE